MHLSSPCTLHVLPVHTVGLHENEVTDLKTKGLHPLCNSTAQPQCLTSLHIPGTSYIPKDSTKVLCQVTSIAKQLDPTAQSNSSENVDREMQLPAYQNEGVHHLAAAKISHLMWSRTC